MMHEMLTGDAAGGMGGLANLSGRTFCAEVGINDSNWKGLLTKKGTQVGAGAR
jgi:hypothetical protein